MHEGEESVDSNIIKLTEEEVEEERNTKKLLRVEMQVGKKAKLNLLL